jgi:type III secretory pathway component EscV
MSKLSATKFIVFTILLSFSFTLCEAQDSKRPASSKPNNGLMAKPTGRNKATNTKGPVSVKNAKKKAEDKDKKRKKDFVKYVKENQKRSIQIQTPEVQARMKQNVKDSNANYKVKKKRNVSKNRSAGRKYR